MPSARISPLIAAVALFIGAPIAGCVNAKALEEARIKAVEAASMDDVDLGKYYATLPQMPGESGGGEIGFHAFAKVARRDRSALDAALEDRRPELRSRLLVAIRSLNEAQYEEPKLMPLRDAVAGVINDALEKKIVLEVGFYEFSYKQF